VPPKGGHRRGKSLPAHSLDGGRQVHRRKDDQEGAGDEEGLYHGRGGRQRGGGHRGGEGHQRKGNLRIRGGPRRSSCHLFGGGERSTLCPAAFAAPLPGRPCSKRQPSVQPPTNHSCLQYVQQQKSSHSHKHDNLERVRHRAEATAQVAGSPSTRSWQATAARRSR